MDLFDDRNQNEQTKQEPTFEQAMNQLESIVMQLEKGDVPLEQAISYFQEGMKLSKLCHDKLQKVNEQMELIVGENGEVKPFDLKES